MLYRICQQPLRQGCGRASSRRLPSWKWPNRPSTGRGISSKSEPGAGHDPSLRWLGWTFGIATPLVFAGTIHGQLAKPLLLDDGDDHNGSFSFNRLFKANDAKDKQDAFSNAGIPNKTQTPPPQTRGDSYEVASGTSHISVDEVETPTDFLTTLKNSVPGFDMSNIGDKIGDLILPDWFKILPGYIRKLQAEMSMAPGSLAEEIWREANDVEINPEIMWDANVRISRELCNEEQAFLQKRKLHVRKALAKYLGIPEEEIHPDDVPTIAICGSGGGLRAMVAGTSSLLSTGEAGLFDCATYTAGVSGSCWLQTLFYSSIGRQDHMRMIDHLKHRLGIHIAFPPAALSLISQAPTNKYLMSGIVEKFRGLPNADFGLVDIYGLLLAARLMVPKGDLSINFFDLKVSDQCRFVDRGAFPLPIYTAVRHEIPDDAIAADTESLKDKAQKEAWFQWFEWTPYEFFCEELEAGIPTYAVGRTFERGRTAWRDNGLALPELRLPVLMGIWGSAFCATLSHYYKEIRPVMKGLAGFAGIDELIAEKDEDLIKLHPIDPATIPNFAINMKDFLPATCPESIHKATHLQLMDAGMSNNLPIYPLLRPGRDVDIIVAFDASADVKKDNWLKVTDGYVRQRGIRGWPMGSGWPTEEETSDEAAVELEQASAHSVEEAEKNLEKAQAEDKGTGPSTATTKSKPGLGYCTVWCGSKEERLEHDEPPPSKKVEEDWQLMEPNAGVTVVYFPLIPNDKAPGVDPQKSEFLSTWNFVYSSEEIDKVVALARSNFEAGKEQTRRTVKAVWERKRKQRLERESEDRDSRWALNLAKARKKGRYGDQGDHFS
ncbi:phospholipase-like protein 1 [Elsinoe australis]|uniref:Lysophospholipase n=1 Tax=Elsinoe australis TaxID=40998 RepID=A0A4U7B090_9PEZI|nr:phospholipase-like protein 1 [Elsinoe australis]